MFKPAEIIGFR